MRKINWILLLVAFTVGVAGAQVPRYNPTRPISIDTLAVRDSLTVYGPAKINGITALPSTTTITNALTLTGNVDLINAITTIGRDSTTANVDSGTIDGVTFGGSSPGAGAFTTLKSDSLNIDSGVLLVDPTLNEVSINNTGSATALGAGLTVGSTTGVGEIGIHSATNTDAYLALYENNSLAGFLYNDASDNVIALMATTGFGIGFRTNNTATNRVTIASDGTTQFGDNVTIDVDGTATAGDHDLEIVNGASFSEIDAGETTFANSSSRSLKENFVDVSANSIRSDFMALKVQRYNFKPSTFLNMDIIDSAYVDTLKAKKLGLERRDIDYLKAKADTVQAREHARANAMAQRVRVSVMAEDFYSLSAKLRPAQADSGKIYGDDQIAVLILMVQSLQNQVDSLKTLH